MHRLVAVDAGTTSVRSIATDLNGNVLEVAQRELTQSFPAPGLVEHDASEILEHVDATLHEVAARLDARGDDVAAIGITNQRETTVALDRATGRPLAPAIVWQDRRTASACAALVERGDAQLVRAVTGLPIDPYFSATKMQWLLGTGRLDGADDLGLCTVDTLVCWHLTGGVRGGAFVTDRSNASRTMLYDLDADAWSAELCELFGVPRSALAELRPSCGVLGTLDAAVVGPLAGTPVASILGDQQAALFGQRCTRPGMVKATYGTGAFLLANAGEHRPRDVDGIVTTVAWDLGEHGGRSIALEGAAFVAGAAIQWLRDELGVAATSPEVGALAASVEDAAGAMFVPALVGLGSPWWDPDARGTLVGLSRGVTRAHVARAVVDALAFQGRAMLEAMREGIALSELRIDGGAAAMDLLCQQLADGARTTVRRPTSVEATAIGAALCAGIAVGLMTLGDVEASWREEACFEPSEPTFADLAYEGWLDQVARARSLGSR